MGHIKRFIVVFTIGFIGVTGTLIGAFLDSHVSYDYFRGLPDGSWNGNTGVVFALDGGLEFSNYCDVRFGSSYGIYNWNGRGNVVFANPKEVEQMFFVTFGLTSSCKRWNWGIVYDQLFTNNFSIYCLCPRIDQLRAQVSYAFCANTLGLWATHYVTEAEEIALGIPINFRAISQVNLFWKHFFRNCAQTAVWMGMPYRDSLMFPHQLPASLIAGFSFRILLTNRFFLDGKGAYMFARSATGAIENRNYGSNLCIGITYSFGPICHFASSYMDIGNHANFFVDINANQ